MCSLENPIGKANKQLLNINNFFLLYFQVAPQL